MGIVNEIITDNISFNVNLLTDLGKEWIPRITDDVLLKTENCIRALGSLAINLAKASGADKEDKKLLSTVSAKAREAAYYFFDTPFRTWLSLISPLNDDKDKKCIEWKEYMRNSILRMGTEMVSDSGEHAYVGQNETYNVSTAYLQFKNIIFKEVPSREQKGGSNG